MNKKKIINDPVYGFVSIPSELIFDLIQHPFFQRLRYIKQVSMTHLVYPGALHTRFQHAIGAMHLMSMALETLIYKGVEITDEEQEAALIAILLHDIGHGPFSHSLEHTLIEHVPHELLSSLLIDRLNQEFNGQLDLAKEIFEGKYPRNFLHQLVASQLDTDRMDYLIRDSFFTGVSEGVISFDRIIKMLDVVDDFLVVESKGIYSVEKFLIARRLMYWQVYFHKAVVAAEQMLIQALKRAKYISQTRRLFATPALQHFLVNKVNRENLFGSSQHMDRFTELDDSDILASMKNWVKDSDKVLSLLCERLMSRNLFKTYIRDTPISAQQLKSIRETACTIFGCDMEEASYLVIQQQVFNSAYDLSLDNIKILEKTGELKDIVEASDLSNLEAIGQRVEKYFLTFPKELDFVTKQI
ncbi:MAG TPA: HD domain-containing protein [Candidatus Sphingobacterium stercoripullorum]|uniref:HD domain-containing protein n=1 Tax=Candidatus Sphingobacterium stercoripullorum TaxID=2838759 RepID=A0A9D2AYI8_9SPHI|nr:HD domain-containing protein [Candidatus Sphingobacterium stercoripullorum]